ncbi:MAG: accessory gene regulator B family protein [Syntrophomonadaceae bacterium]|nr:accessory gene regulator B family protein [Syntrophomonadaceae bacterium]
MIHELSLRWGQSIADTLNTEEKAATYALGLELIIIQGISLVVILGLAAALGLMKTTLLFLAIFIPFRIWGGGPHLASFACCLPVSCILILGPAWGAAAAIWPSPVLAGAAGAGLLLGVWAVARWVPADTEKYPITDPQVRRQRKRIMARCLLLWSMATGFCFLQAYGTAAQALVAGAGISLLLMSPAGYTLMGFIDKIFEKEEGEAA